MTADAIKKMRNQKAYWIAGGAALLGAVLMQRQVATQVDRPQQERKQETYRVVVAKQNLKAGEVLKPEDHLELAEVRMSRLPRNIYEAGKIEAHAESGANPENSDMKWDDLKSELNGRTLGADVSRGDLLLRTDFDAGTEYTLDTVLPGGKRAVSVIVDRAATMGGLLLPNARVDVVAFFRSTATVQGKTREGYDQAKIILCDIPVLAVGGRLSRSGGAAVGGGSDNNSVVLSLDPDEALKLSLAQRNAQISLLLRPQGGGGDYARKEIEMKDITDLIKEMENQPGGRP